MEIENNHLTTVTGHTAGTASAGAKPAESATAEATKKSGSSDTVSLTPVARLLRNVEASIAEQPVVDHQRVSATRDAINDGSFEVNPLQIASKMMSLEQALSDQR